MQTEDFKNRILPLKNKLFRKALSITKSTTDAEDVVQEVMIRMWEKRVEWNKIGNIEVYCMVLTKNMSLDLMKKAGRNNDSIEDESIIRLESETTQPLEKMIQSDTYGLIWKIIISLPEKQQDIIRLREIEELTYQEIATEMNIPESQVKIILFRVRKKIKERYLQIDNYGL